MIDERGEGGGGMEDWKITTRGVTKLNGIKKNIISEENQSFSSFPLSFPFLSITCSSPRFLPSPIIPFQHLQYRLEHHSKSNISI